MATTSVGGIAAALLVPKCPMCLVAALSAAGGLGWSAAADMTPLSHPGALALGVSALAAIAAVAWKGAEKKGRSCCAPPRG